MAWLASYFFIECFTSIFKASTSGLIQFLTDIGILSSTSLLTVSIASLILAWSRTKLRVRSAFNWLVNAVDFSSLVLERPSIVLILFERFPPKVLLISVFKSDSPNFNSFALATAIYSFSVYTQSLTLRSVSVISSYNLVVISFLF